jgi:spore coat polysaccharide biosynthesis predicted glycosyltransferase SpsG
LALADCLRSGYGIVPTFLLKSNAAAVSLVNEQGFHTEKIPQNLSQQEEFKALADAQWDVAVVDLPLKNLRALDLNGFGGNRQTVAILDGYDHAQCSADLVINGSLKAETALTPNDNLENHLFGVDYCVLSETYRATPERQYSTTSNTILIVSGGADPASLIPKIIKVISEACLPVNVDIIVGPGMRASELGTSIANTGPTKFRLVENATNLKSHMLAADFVISAAGRTAYELAVTGTPSIFIPSAAHETITADLMASNGAAINIGMWDEKISPKKLRSSMMMLSNHITKRRSLGENGRKLIDGRGCQRVCDRIMKL